MINTNLYVKQNPGIVGQLLNDEAVLLLPGKGEVKVLNEVGARIWSLADGTRTIAGIAAVISTEYAVEHAQAEVDTVAFVGELAQRDMVALNPEPPNPATLARC